MRYSVRYKRAAVAEVESAISWYGQPEINQASAFVADIERTESHLRTHPELYQRVAQLAGLYPRTGSGRRAGVHAPALETSHPRGIDKARAVPRTASCVDTWEWDFREVSAHSQHATWRDSPYSKELALLSAGAKLWTHTEGDARHRELIGHAGAAYSVAGR